MGCNAQNFTVLKLTSKVTALAFKALLLEGKGYLVGLCHRLPACLMVLHSEALLAHADWLLEDLVQGEDVHLLDGLNSYCRCVRRLVSTSRIVDEPSTNHKVI